MDYIELVNISLTSPNSALSPCRFIGNADLAMRIMGYYKLIGVLSMCSSFLSIVGSLSILAFVAHKRVCLQPEIRPLFHLTVADLILAVLWFVSPTVYFVNGQSLSSHPVGCFVMQTVTEIVHVITFFLTINYAANVYLCMKERASRLDDLEMPLLPTTVSRRKWMRPLCCASAWIFPFALFLPFVVHMSSEYIDACQCCIMLIDAPRPKRSASIWKNYGYIVMVVTLSASIIANVVLYALTLRLYRRSVPANFHTDRERLMIHRLTQRTLKFILAFLICWSPALLIVSIDLQLASYEAVSFHPVDRYIALYVIQAMTAPLQGCLNSLVYGWGRRTFREIVFSPSRRNSRPAATEEPWTSDSDAQQLMTS